MGSSHQGFYPNLSLFQDGGYKTRRIINYFSKEAKKKKKKKKKEEFICVKVVITLIFYNEKVPFKDFLSKI